MRGARATTRQSLCVSQDSQKRCVLSGSLYALLILITRLHSSLVGISKLTLLLGSKYVWCGCSTVSESKKYGAFMNYLIVDIFGDVFLYLIHICLLQTHNQFDYIFDEQNHESSKIAIFNTFK